MTERQRIRLLFDAIAAGRAALHERDERDVPARLRPVAASSGRSLPPPLAARLLAELDSDETLRAEAAEQLPDESGRPSVLFLERPEGWESEYDAFLDDLAMSETRSELDLARNRITELERELKTARAKARAAVKKSESVAAEADARVGEARADVKSAGRASAARARDLAARLEESDRQRAARAAELQDLRTELAALRAQLTKRDERAVTPPTVAPPRAGGDPESMAIALDDLLVRAQRRHQPAPLRTRTPEVLDLPSGIAPDRADAVEWLLASGRPQVWLIDGHNLAHRLAPSRFTDPQLRIEIAEHARRLRRVALGPLRTVIVFDTRSASEDIVPAGPGVDVVFAPDADAEVVRLAEVHGSEAVVVSSDREVREAASAGGAVVVWSDALVEYVRS